MDGYYKQAQVKDKICLHHTGGSHNPFWVIDGWMAAKKKIGTAWVIGGKANPPYKDEHDGRIVNYYMDQYWSHHLGIREANYQITKATVPIELCNYGGLIQNSSGQFLTYVNSLVPPDQVTKCSFRGYEYFEAYTVNQIEALKTLLLDIASRHTIDLHEGMYKMLKNGKKAFELQTSALSGKPGLWSHGNYRRDKTDVAPQENLIEMILSL